MSNSDIQTKYQSIKKLFKTEDKIPYAEILLDDKTHIFPIYSKEMDSLITRLAYEETGKPPSKKLKENIQSGLAAEAIFKGPTEEVFLRVSETSETIEIDLNNVPGDCVLVNKGGWKVAKSKSNFYRPPSSKEMTVPQTGGRWEMFKKHFHTKTEEDLMLIIGFIISCYRSKGPYPVLVLQGEQGSAKSTTARMIKSLVDPSGGATRGLIKREHDLFIAAKNNHLLSFDNVSVIKNDLSDTLCRIATGGSFSARSLYTNDSEILLELCKPVLLNGISDFVTRADLVSRSIIIELAPIPAENRKPENEVIGEFNADLPLMLSVIMNGLSSALRNKRYVHLSEMPRMADVALWCTAAEEGLGWEAGSFLRAYNSNQSNAILNSLSTDPVALALRAMMFAHPNGSWSGTATELLKSLDGYKPYMESSRSWPSSPAYLSQCLSRLAPNLRHLGLDFVGRDRTSNQRSLTIVKLSHYEEMHRDYQGINESESAYPSWLRHDGHDRHDRHDDENA